MYLLCIAVVGLLLFGCSVDEIVSGKSDSSRAAATHTVEFISWNLYNNAGASSSDGIAKWANRKAAINSVLDTQAPAVLALQEDGKLVGLTYSLMSEVTDMLGSGYHKVYTSAFDGERLAIYAKTSKLTIVDSGVEKWSTDPTKRGIVWAQIDPVDQDYNRFFVINAHFKAGTSTDSVNQRRAQAKLVLDTIAAFDKPGQPVFLMGDLNVETSEEAFLILTGATGYSSPYGTTRYLRDTAVSYPFNTNPTSNPTRRIDYIMATDFGIDENDVSTIQGFTIGADPCYGSEYMSNHLGVRVRCYISN